MIRHIARLALLSLVASSLGVIAAIPSVGAMPTVIAGDVLAGGPVNVTSFTDDPAVPFTNAGDGFQVFQRGVSASIPFSLADDSAVGFPTDSLGIVTEADLDPFFGITDTVNPDTTGPVTATWVFDISSGVAPLALSIDMAAMGDFEASDSFAWTYAIDAGASTPVFAIAADEAIDATYTLAGGVSYPLDDPLTESGTVLTNVFQTRTAALAGSGSTLTLSLTVDADGGSEATAFRNIVVTADGGGTGPMPGDLVITEIMQNPSAVSDSAGEWFEITNVSLNAIDIDGWTISDNGTNSHTINNGGPLVVPASGYVVLGNNTDSGTNGGVTVDYSYGTSIALANGDDEVILTNPDSVEFDRVEYDGGPNFPDPTGASTSLDPGAVDTASNDDGSNWCTASSALAGGDLGTPGAANDTCPVGTTPALIHDIQGSGDSVVGAGTLYEVTAVVVGDYQLDDQLDGFFIQEEDADADADPATSEGIFVYCDTCPDGVAEGDLVTVVGIAEEFFGMSQLDTGGPDASVTVIGTASLPSASAIDLPIAAPDVDAFYETLEGMRVTFVDPLVVSEYFAIARFGQVVLYPNARPYQYSQLDDTPTVAEYAAYQDSLDRARVILDDDDNRQNSPLPDGVVYHPQPDGFSIGAQGVDYFRGGDTVASLTGVLHWSFAGSGGTDAWRIRPTSADPAVFTPVNLRESAPDVGGTFTVASLNVLNYFSTVDEGPNVCGPVGGQDCRGADSEIERQRQLDKIVATLSEMDADVIGLVEIENNAAAALDDIVAALPGYGYIDTGTIGTDAIKVAFIYRTATAAPVGDFAILDSSVDPTFNDDKNRPALFQTFEEIATGGQVNVVVNHLKSKGSPCDDVNDPDLGDGQANCNLTRAAAATAIANWVASDPTGTGEPDTLVIGDLNSYAGEDPIGNLQAAGYEDLLQTRVGPDAYTYLFDGQLGTLDYALANDTLSPQVVGVAAWHTNADEVPLFDYNDEIEDPGEAFFEAEPSGNPLFEANAYRASDHDPVLVGLALEPPVPTCNGLEATIIGTDGDDRIEGTPGPDVIVGLGGNDIIRSLGGDDVVCGDDGNDRIFGGQGDDFIDGGADFDHCVGGPGTDTGINCERPSGLWK